MPSITRFSISFILFALLLSACAGSGTNSAIATNAAQAQQVINPFRNAAEPSEASLGQDDAAAADGGGEDDAESAIATGVAQRQQKVSEIGNAASSGLPQDNGSGDGTEAEGAAPTASVTAPTIVDWNGSWQFWVGALTFTQASIVQSGDSISGSFFFESIMISFSGSLSADQQVATGTWENDADGVATGTFQWQIKSGNLNQFVGNLDGGENEWCGAKNGASRPSPCLWP